MRSSDADFLRQLRGTFLGEAQEHLEVITSGLLQLEQVSDSALQRPIIETVFRAAHSLKGAARAVELPEIERACQELEETFAGWKRQTSAPTRQTVDALHVVLGRIPGLLVRMEGSAPAPAMRTGLQPQPLPPQPVTEVASVAPPARETVRIGVDLLDARLLETEEMLMVKLAARQRVEDLRTIERRLQTLRVELSTGGPERVQALEREVAGLARGAERDSEAVAKLVDELLANSKKLLLLPFATIASAFPKLVRDLAREQRKEAELEIAGEHIELDKRILDALKDPLIHLLRNCVDHGIEAPAERTRRGKPARARIAMTVTQLAGGKVQLTLADDGGGIDSAKVKAAAVRQGLVTPAEAALLSDDAARALVFRSGLSTSPMITVLSGRGLGLAIVQEKAAGLGGEVSVQSEPGAGTTFRIVVPAMRTTFRGVLVEAAGHMLVLPAAQVACAARVRPGDIHTMEGRDTWSLGERVLPVVSLAQVLQLRDGAAAGNPGHGGQLVVAGAGDQRVAFLVDQVLDEQEFLVKPLAPPLVRVRNVASAAILPSGRTAFVLHVPDLLQSARGAAAQRRSEPQAEAGEAKSILVAEDSITSRTLIKDVLESGGYQVTTAVDGMDAFNRLRAGNFDLLVSDVEMPRLNGFDLTARIRADRRLAELPVVLVTALESREQRERGVDTGANAYIVKSSFDQSTLLDAVRRLA